MTTTMTTTVANITEYVESGVGGVGGHWYSGSNIPISPRKYVTVKAYYKKIIPSVFGIIGRQNQELCLQVMCC